MSSTRTNQFAFAFVVLLLFLSPLPLGSNRPFFWMLNTLLVSAAALVYAAMLRFDSSRLRVPLRAVSAPAALLLATMAWMAVQLLPLPSRVMPFDAWDTVAAALDRTQASRISVDPAATFAMILRFGTYGLLFFLALQATANPDRARRMIQLLFWIIALHAAIAILMLLEFGDRIFVFEKWAYRGYATGSFVNRNSFATYGAFGVGIGTLLLLEAYLAGDAAAAKAARAARRFELLRTLFVYGTGLAIIGSAVVLSASRMGAAAALLGVFTAFLIALVRSSARRGTITAAFGGVICIGLLVALFSGGGLAERIGSIENSADERLLLYRQVLDMIVARPWTGFGGGTFADAFPLFHKLPLSADVTWDAAHNTYLELFADLGFAAVAPLLAIFVLFVAQLRAVRSPDISWVAPGAAIVVVVIGAVHSLADFSLQIEANAFVLVTVLAVGTAQASIGRRKPQPRPLAGRNEHSRAAMPGE